MLDNIVVKIDIGNASSIRLEYIANTAKITAEVEGKIDARYAQLLNIIIESIKAEEVGIPLNRYFFPQINKKIAEQAQELSEPYFKLKWGKTGILRPIGPTNKRFQHVINPEDALKRKRVFTCDMEIVSQIPRRKISQTPEEKKVEKPNEV